MQVDPRSGRKIVRGTRSAADPVVESGRATLLDQAFQTFYASKKAEGMRDRTLEEYISNWRYFREWLAHEVPEVRYIQQVSADTIRSYVNYMSEKRRYSEVACRKQTCETLSPYTVALRLRALRTMFNFLHREELIAVNPISNIKQPRFDNEGKETLSAEQMEQLLGTPDTTTYAGFRDRTLMLLLADGGFRIHEALRLKADNIDLHSRCVHLPAWMNKNRKPRIVPISSHVIREVMQLIDENQRYFNSDHLFLSNYGEPLKADHFRKRLKQYAKAAGLRGADISPHRFRSFFCREFLVNGGDLFSLQRIVAHASIETTKRYVRMNDDIIRKQHEHFSPIARMGLSRINKRM
ncbi:hypothetical protein J19TS2_49350 [Cohnella xylanilytica]|uniref:tyrosine-type recombinase/integrase n=1 Tax=Cohnella xylanilytica TaxID=557555 RepID=UPI001B09F187|nr:tyrosine-type recombinase/integrase [Cohnella xylanilytica]GIO15380.1 hypothetical protein J19TS2_49350 [Cohnella xylanilytica]